MSDTSGAIIVTGAAGFIGSALVRKLMRDGARRVVSLDALTYAGDEERLAAVNGDPRHHFVNMDVRDSGRLDVLFAAERPAIVYHLAAETHVDRSIDGPEEFVQSNTVGTLRLLESTRRYLASVGDAARSEFRLVAVSTDEVYGSLGSEGAFTETSPFAPRSPYSASKAAADHLSLAYFHTFGLPVMVTHASNNYGPYQFPEKLIPLALARALSGQAVPLYGDGSNIRDWLHVDDHAEALIRVAAQGCPGETYLIGGGNERSNRHLLDTLLGILNDQAPHSGDYRDLITKVPDRPGHDFRYAVDTSKSQRDLGWRPSVTFEEGMAATVAWYLANQEWTKRVTDGSYRLERLGSGFAEGRS